jgi:hypothetical protein
MKQTPISLCFEWNNLDEKNMEKRGIIDESAPKAIVFLHKRNDHKNKALLTKDDLIVIRKARSHIYKLDNIKSVGFRTRKFLLPLVVGGILTPMGIVAMFGNYFNPYWVVLLILVGIYLLYEGFSDRWSLTIKGFSNEESISLLYVSDNLRAFIDFVTGHLPHATDTIRRQGYLYLKIPEDLWKMPVRETPIDLGKSVHKAFTRRQWEKSGQNIDPGQVVLVLDPWLAPVSVSYENDVETGLLRPQVTGIVPATTIIDVILHRA